MKRCLLTAIAIAGLSVFAMPGAEPIPGPYNVAAYASDGVGVNSRLLVFPPVGKDFSIPLPLTLRSVSYGSDGRTLYAAAFDRPGLLKIQFDPVRISTLANPEAFYSIDRFAVSRREDLVLFSGTRRDPSGGETCGIFELSLSNSGLHAVLVTSDCGAGSPWRVFDLSPNAHTALIRNTDRRLALLHLDDGEVTKLGSDLWMASFSPDGQWIAALETVGSRNLVVGSRTVLIDTKNLTRRRDLGGSNDNQAVWSPDSRFLLHIVDRRACQSGVGSALEMLDIQTGKRSTIQSSICNASTSGEIGWLSTGS